MSNFYKAFSCWFVRVCTYLIASIKYPIVQSRQRTGANDMKEMRELAKYIESAGYTVRILQVMQNDVIEVDDPVHSDGKIIGTSPVRLYRPRDAHKFINERS
jgi:hypothetical protein